MLKITRQSYHSLACITNCLLHNNFCLIKDINASKPNGKLSIVATPIGNLSDLTPNILKCLFQADLIGCQDRRVAGQLYTLVRNKNILQKVQDKFGTIGISNLVISDQKQHKIDTEAEKYYQYYQYSHMTDRKRRKFLSKMSLQQQKQFKIEYLKYRAKKIINKNQQFTYKSKHDKFDQLYGIQVSDLKHIQAQIMSTRAKKGRGLLIPLNTYSETKMFDMVRNLLQSKHVAIVSDAGMPCISDPGWKMVRMIRESMPTVPIQIIGGPSAIDIMLTMARLTSNSESLSGRFEGFASPQISSMTEQNVTYNKSLRQAKEKDFSIHFINSKKLKKNVYALQRIYGEKHRIIVANQLTKKYERKFNGNLGELVQQVGKDKNEFEGIGEMSYLLYSDKPNNQQSNISDQNNNNNINNAIKKTDQTAQSQQENDDSKIVSIDVTHFVKSLSNTELKSKQKAELVCAVFGLKLNQAKNIVYQCSKEKEKSITKSRSRSRSHRVLDRQY